MRVNTRKTIVGIVIVVAIGIAAIYVISIGGFDISKSLIKNPVESKETSTANTPVNPLMANPSAIGNNSIATNATDDANNNNNNNNNNTAAK